MQDIKKIVKTVDTKVDDIKEMGGPTPSKTKPVVTEARRAADEKMRSLLKIDVVNREAERLFRSPAFAGWMEEQMLKQLAGTDEPSYGANFNRAFLSTLFSNRIVNCLLWADSKKYVNVLTS